MTELRELKEILLREGYTCVLSNGADTVTSRARGVKPLLEFLDSGNYAGYYAADKVVGKAAAFLYVCMGVAALHACVISEAAIEVCRRHGIAVGYDVATSHIINRKGDGLCPMEQTVAAIDDPQAAKAAIIAKIKAGI